MRWLVPGVLTVLLAATAAVFLPLADAGFVVLDDDQYIVENPVVAGGLSWRGVAWAFTTGHARNYHPLTWLSHMLDASLYGLRPRGHHLTNVLIHLANTALLFGLLLRMTGALGRSAIVAAYFAVHPLHVESVAWVSERKDLLAGFFFLATLAAYRRYCARPGTGRYLAVAGLFVLGLLSKPMVVTLPLVLLLLDAWPLGRFGTVPARRLVAEKLPLLALSLASSVATLVAQKGAMADLSHLPAGARLSNAVLSYARYLWMALVPRNLSTHYPFPDPPTPPAAVLGMAAAGLAACVIALRLARRRPYVAVGWFWYVVMLLPVIGIVHVGWQAMADRYTYLPLTGVLILAAWLVTDVTAANRAARAAALALVAGHLAFCAVASRDLAATWRDDVLLYRHAVEANPADWVSKNRLGVALAKRGEVAEAVALLAVNPVPEKARFNMAWAWSINGATDRAIEEYLAALRIRYDYPDAHANLGAMLLDKGMLPESILHLREALRLNPSDSVAWNSMGVAFLRLGNRAEAERAFRQALRTNPDFPLARQNLALVTGGR